MPWKESRVVDERGRFVLAVEAGEEPVAAICRRFGISRQQGYKWLGRWRAEGIAGLACRSRAPHHHPQAVAEELLEAALAVRRAHPTWGPVKTRANMRANTRTQWALASSSAAASKRSRHRPKGVARSVSKNCSERAGDNSRETPACGR